MRKIRPFFHSSLLKTKGRAWLAASVFAFFIPASAPWILVVSKWLRSHNLLRVSLALLTAGFLGYLFSYFFVRLKITQIKAYLFIALLLFLGYLVMRNVYSIEERVHLLEFSLLALLFFKAVKFSLRGWGLYLVPFGLAALVGWLDEVWQGVLPNRVYDVKDILYNTAGGFLGIGLAWVRQRFGRVEGAT